MQDASTVFLQTDGSGNVTLPGVAHLGISGTTSGELVMYGSTSGEAELIATSGGGLQILTGATPTLGFAVGGSGSVSMPLIASSSAPTTGTLCWTTGTGGLTVDTTLACLSSLEELKDIRAPIDGEVALDEVSRLRPVWGTWRKDSPEYAGDAAEQPFLTAHQVESVDPRLVGYGPDGALRGVRYMEMSAVLVSAVQKLRTENDNLQRQVDELRRRFN
jgi:hypothetical protein